MKAPSKKARRRNAGQSKLKRLLRQILSRKISIHSMAALEAAEPRGPYRRVVE